MAKSKIIKDLANSSVDTMTALKRAKVLLSEIDNEDVNNWVNYEIAGYPDDVALPDYRITKGNLFGSYFKGSMASHMTWTNVSIPLGKMPDELQNSLLQISFRQSVEALKKLAESTTLKDGQLGKVIPADLFPSIASFNNDPYMIITSARVIVGEQCISDIFAAVENRLLDVLILLEKEFGNLDELDLDVTTKTPDELKSIAERIILIVYNDQSVTIGNNNKIKDSTIASKIEEQKYKLSNQRLLEKKSILEPKERYPVLHPTCNQDHHGETIRIYADELEKHLEEAEQHQ